MPAAGAFKKDFLIRYREILVTLFFNPPQTLASGRGILFYS
jgi:hypothetical protein